jgi:hypothetical protein
MPCHHTSPSQMHPVATPPSHMHLSHMAILPPPFQQHTSHKYTCHVTTPLLAGCTPSLCILQQHMLYFCPPHTFTATLLPPSSLMGPIAMHLEAVWPCHCLPYSCTCHCPPLQPHMPHCCTPHHCMGHVGTSLSAPHRLYCYTPCSCMHYIAAPCSVGTWAYWLCL